MSQIENCQLSIWYQITIPPQQVLSYPFRNQWRTFAINLISPIHSRMVILSDPFVLISLTNHWSLYYLPIPHARGELWATAFLNRRLAQRRDREPDFLGIFESYTPSRSGFGQSAARPAARGGHRSSTLGSWHITNCRCVLSAQ